MKELVLEAMRKNVESTSVFPYGTYGTIYLDNVYSDLSDKMSRHEFAGYCSVLRKERKYQQIDGFFGEVLLETPLTE